MNIFKVLRSFAICLGAALGFLFMFGLCYTLFLIHPIDLTILQSLVALALLVVSAILGGIIAIDLLDK